MSQEIPSNKITVKNRGEATVKILETFRNKQRENYSTLDYHNEHHPEMVRKRALEFARVLGSEDHDLVTKETLINIVDSAASHDSVLNFSHGEMITRWRGFFESDIKGNYRPAMEAAGIKKGNELLSAEELETEMFKYVDKKGEPVFDQQAKEEMFSAIAATFPEFDFTATISDQDMERYFKDLEKRGVDLQKYRTGVKVWQPYLKADSPITAIAVATGDLRGNTASSNYEDLRKDGNGEFRELNEGLRSAIGNDVATIPSDKKAKFAESMIKWVKSQATFTMWQKILFWQSIDENNLINQSPKSAEIKKALHNHYDRNFDNNILKSIERYERLEKKYGETEAQRAEHLAQITNTDFEELLTELEF